jgi:hypothetical protein
MRIKFCIDSERARRQSCGRLFTSDDRCASMSDLSPKIIHDDVSFYLTEEFLAPILCLDRRYARFGKLFDNCSPVEVASMVESLAA